jgi:hypothetical protein
VSCPSHRHAPRVAIVGGQPARRGGHNGRLVGLCTCLYIYMYMHMYIVSYVSVSESVSVYIHVHAYVYCVIEPSRDVT